MADFEHEHAKAANPIRRTSEAPVQATEHPLLKLQSQVGNAQVARMLAQRMAPEEEELMQASRVQREPEEEEELMQASRVQRQAEVGAEGGEISDQTSQQIAQKRGSGSSLDNGMRASMEAAFETDFSDVRVHTDSASDSLNKTLGAQAFTTGSDIFMSGKASPSDSHLMAHELTHVVQQRSMNITGPSRVTASNDVHEQEAEAMAETVTQRMHNPEAEQAE